jgi:NADH-quinone oxidoreductase subunit G
VRRNGVKLAVATSRPSSLDANATTVARYAPGAGEAFLAAVNAALGGGGVVEELAAAAGADAAEVTALAELLSAEDQDDVVIVWGERLTHGPRAAHAARALLNVAGRVVASDHDGAGLLELPAGTNGRGLREAGVLPNAGPGLTPVNSDGLDSTEIGRAIAAGQLSALVLLHVDPLRDLPGRRTWTKALNRADTVVAYTDFLTEGVREHATVVFPAESYAEKEGTVVHPDGRIQRLRKAIARPGDVRAEWEVLAELCRRLDHDPGVGNGIGTTVSSVLFDAIPFYTGLTLDEIGGRGVRWPALPANAAAWPEGDTGPFGLEPPPHAASPNGALRLGTFRSIWAAPEVERSPALKFLRQVQRAEMNPVDAERLGVAHGDAVVIGSNGHRVSATVALRSGVPEGSVFLEEGLDENSATELDAGLVEIVPA